MITIRTESTADYKSVFQLNYIAFENRNDEAELVEKIRASDSFIPELSLVAEKNDEIIGHVLLSKARVIDNEKNYEVIVLAPIAVMPNYQKSGVGSKLIHEGLKRTAELGYKYVFLIGHPDYYPKFGFKPARAFGFEIKQFDVPDAVFMMCDLNAGKSNNSINGELKYPDTFFN
ncbi:GNAT family N-acetyltransferase [Paenibacillus sp. L3-i20]|uniref:GNAT family N-acetyltransferase n=1 Tax=Paenibacillus sp. L3-i20 TaxID=2905833 RepID=UPI001EDDB71B|nr:N-acetyltransferase [Paenibacillus sp. L3-i20]GKU79452.1 N-acetyltransferase [Paenibacillus sp. L3-i20]